MVTFGKIVRGLSQEQNCQRGDTRATYIRVVYKVKWKKGHYVYMKKVGLDFEKRQKEIKTKTPSKSTNGPSAAQQQSQYSESRKAW